MESRAPDPGRQVMVLCDANVDDDTCAIVRGMATLDARRGMPPPLVAERAERIATLHGAHVTLELRPRGAVLHLAAT